MLDRTKLQNLLISISFHHSEAKSRSVGRIIIQIQPSKFGWMIEFFFDSGWMIELYAIITYFLRQLL
jgi:hypothetical protein